jgi:hypothetical protein
MVYSRLGGCVKAECLLMTWRKPSGRSSARVA